MCVYICIYIYIYVYVYIYIYTYIYVPTNKQVRTSESRLHQGLLSANPHRDTVRQVGRLRSRLALPLTHTNTHTHTHTDESLNILEQMYGHTAAATHCNALQHTATHCSTRLHGHTSQPPSEEPYFKTLILEPYILSAEPNTPTPNPKQHKPPASTYTTRTNEVLVPLRHRLHASMSKTVTPLLIVRIWGGYD